MADSRRAYGLAKEYGIDTSGMSPKEVWEALAEKGITQDRSSKTEQAVDKYSDSPERDKKAMRDSGQLVSKKKGYIQLPEREYAELCSAVRTKYANKIPAKGQILYGKNYYQFRYNKRQERIVYTFKLRIVGNEKAINYYWENFDNE